VSKKTPKSYKVDLVPTELNCSCEYDADADVDGGSEQDELDDSDEGDWGRLFGFRK
jgi:hypothetical protein